MSEIDAAIVEAAARAHNDILNREAEEFGWTVMAASARRVRIRAMRAALQSLTPATAIRLEEVERERDIALHLHRDALRLAGQDVTQAYEIGRGLRPSPFENGWLIAAWNSKTGELAGKWFNLVGFLDGVGDEWTTLSENALRFAREEDAQAYIAETGWTEAKPTEHGWGKPIGSDLQSQLTVLQAECARKTEALEPHVFLDCDGVLADFDAHGLAYFGMPPRRAEAELGAKEFWRQLEARGDFYRSMPLMTDAKALYEGVKHLHPTILTGCPKGDWAQGQKVAWAAEHFPGVPIITCRSADKRNYAKPGDVLIDDWPQHRHRWIEMGGHFITHLDAASSLAALWAHYPALHPSPVKTEGEAK